MKPDTIDLFRGYVPLMNLSSAGVDEEFEDVLTSQTFFIADEIRRRIGDDDSRNARAVRIILEAFDKGLPPRGIYDLDEPGPRGYDSAKRIKMAKVVDRAPTIKALLF